MPFHELKTWPDSFNAIWANQKRHEIRKADRDFQVGDRLYLREFDPSDASYSGRWMFVEVTYLTRAGDWGLPTDLCVMSVSVTERHLAIEGRLDNR